MGVAYIWHFLNDKVSASIVPMDRQYEFVLPVTESYNVISRGPALALGFSAVDGSIVPFFILNRNLRRLGGDKNIILIKNYGPSTSLYIISDGIC